MLGIVFLDLPQARGVLSRFIPVRLIEQDISQEEGHNDACVLERSLGVAKLMIDWGITRIMFSHTHSV